MIRNRRDVFLSVMRVGLEPIIMVPADSFISNAVTIDALI